MVNLTFCRLDEPYPITFWQFRSTTFHLFPFISLQRDDHSCWNFFVDLLSIIWFGAFQMHLSFWSSAVRISFSKRDLRFHWSWGEIGLIFDDHGSWSDLLDAVWYHDGFFQTTAGVRSDRGHLISLNFLGSFWSIRQILFTSVPLYYFDLKSDWLPLLTFAFGSPPEVLPFRYLLFVTIR